MSGRRRFEEDWFTRIPLAIYWLWIEVYFMSTGSDCCVCPCATVVVGSCGSAKVTVGNARFLRSLTKRHLHCSLYFSLFSIFITNAHARIRLRFVSIPPTLLETMYAPAACS